MIDSVDHPDRPLRVVFAGPTGSGKSTLLNGVAGRLVTPSGALRPTTRLPLVFTNAENARDFFASPIEYQVVAGDAPILDEMCLIDSPDIDSTNRANHELSRLVLETADVVVFVASALRYADLVPWRLLRELRERGVPVIHALNRVSTSSAGVVTDFRRMLRREGMSDVVVRIEEHRMRPGGLIPGASIRNLRRRLLEIVRARRREGDAHLAAGTADLGARARALLNEIDTGTSSLQALARQTAGQVRDVRSIDLSDQVGTWSARLHSEKDMRKVRRGWLHRRGLLPRAVAIVSSQIIAAVARSLEGQVRPLDVSAGRVVLDLRPEASGSPHQLGTVIESEVKRWFDSISPPIDLHPEVYAYRRAREALAGVEYVFGVRATEPTEVGLRLEGAIAQIGRRVESTIVSTADSGLGGIDTSRARRAALRLDRAAVLADA